MGFDRIWSELRCDWTNLWLTFAGLAVVLPLLVYLHFRKPKTARVRFSSLRNMKGAKPTLKVRLRHLTFFLRIGAVTLLLAAAAHPYLEREMDHDDTDLGSEERVDNEDQRKKIEVPTEGISIQLLVDRSGSMGPQPRQGFFGGRRNGETNLVRFEGELLSKLDVVKIISKRFINGTKETNTKDKGSIFKGRANDMIGLLTFARYPLIACPLTLRHELLLDYISQAEVVKRQEENGTYIGYALERAVLQIVDAKSRASEQNAYTIKSSIIVLITDGQQAIIHPEDQNDPHKSLLPQDAAKLAVDHDIKVYCIGIMPRIIYDSNGTATPLPNGQFDTSALKEVAEMTGGKFYLARDLGMLTGVYQDIDSLEKSALPTKKELEVRVEKSKEKREVETEKIELFPPLLWLVLVTVLGEIVLNEFYFRRIP